jgi:hypothetical protein
MKWRCLNGLYSDQENIWHNSTGLLPNVAPEVSVLRVTGSRVVTGSKSVTVSRSVTETEVKKKGFF